MSATVPTVRETLTWRRRDPGELRYENVIMGGPKAQRRATVRRNTSAGLGVSLRDCRSGCGSLLTSDTWRTGAGHESHVGRWALLCTEMSQ